MSGASVFRQIGARLVVLLLLGAGMAVGGASLEGEVRHAMFFAACACLVLFLFSFASAWWKGPVATGLCFFAGLGLLAVLQLIPLSSELTGTLPLRSEAYADLSLIAQVPEKVPLSLRPESTLAGFLAFLAPLAGFTLVAALRWNRGAGFLKWVIPLLGTAGAGLGLMQVVLAGNPDLYLYESTRRGLASGFFANPNHQACFLLMCLPFLAVLASDLRREWEGRDDQSALAILYAMMGLLIIAGVLGAGSVAGYILLPVTLLFAAPILVSDGADPEERKPSVLGLIILPVILLLAAALVFTSPRLARIGSTSFEDTPSSRIGIAKVSADMVQEHWLAGTGLGSFTEVYHFYEDPAAIERVYIAHAHNDYLEWLIETGIAGAVLLAAFLLWFLFHALRLWSGAQVPGLRLRRGASVACLVPLLHSLVDYPMRTPSIALLGAMCLAIMIVPRLRNAPVEDAIQKRAEPLTIVEI